MADKFGAARNRSNEGPAKTNEAGLSTNQSSLPGSPRADDDVKIDEIEREKTLSPSLEIAEECVESFIHQGLEDADNDHGHPAPNLSDTRKHELGILKPLSIGTNNKKEGIDQNRLQQNILGNSALHDSEEQDFRGETSNIIIEAKNIINTCLLDAGNLDDRLSINADDDNIDNSEKEVNEMEKETNVEGNAKKNIAQRSFTATKKKHERTCSKSKVNDAESNIENTEKSLDKKCHSVATDDDDVNTMEEDNNEGTKDGIKEKKKHKHHKKHAKKKKKKHKKEKAEKTRTKDSKVPKMDNNTGGETSLKDQLFGMTTNVPSSSTSTKPAPFSLELKSPPKRKLASIVTCVSSSTVSTMYGKDELGTNESVLKRHGVTSKDDDPERWPPERSSKSTESIKEDLKKEKLHRKLSSASKTSETKDQTKDDDHETWPTERSSKSTESIKEDLKKEKLHRKLSSTSKTSETKDQTKDDDHETWPTERSSKSTESIKEDLKKEKLHRKLSSTSKTSETKDQTKDDDTNDQSDKPLREKHKSKSKKKHRNKSHDEEQSSTKEKEKRKRNESSESGEMKVSRQHSYDSSRQSSQSEHQRSRSSRSRSWELEDYQVSRERFSGSGQQYSGSKSKERSRKHRRRSRSSSKYHQRRSRSKSMERIPRYGLKSGSTSKDGQMTEERSRDRERSRSDSERSRSRSVEKHDKRKRDSDRSGKMSIDESSRSDMDSSECNRESRQQNQKERRQHNKTYQSDSTEGSQKSPTRKRASKERAPISIESNAPSRKRTLSRSTSRERSPKKCPRAETEVLVCDRTNLNEDFAVSSLETTTEEDNRPSKENLAIETNKKLVDAVLLSHERKAEAKDEEHVDRESEEDGIEKDESRRDSDDERKQIETRDILEFGQTFDSSDRETDKVVISNDTSEEFKTIGEDIYTSKDENVDSSPSSNTKFCNENLSVSTEKELNAKAKDGDYTVESDHKQALMSPRQISDENTSIVKDEPLNQASTGISNNLFGVPPPLLPPPPPPPPPPLHVLVQNEPVISNPPGGLPMDNFIGPPMVNPYLRTFPDSGMLIHQQPHSVPQCPYPQIQSANQNAFSQLDMTSVGNVVPQGFTLGPNQEPLKDITSAHSSHIEQSSLLRLPSSASAIPFLCDEGPKILTKKKKEASNNGDKNEALPDHNPPTPVDMDMSSPEDIIEKMNEEFWENERKGTERNDHSVPEDKGQETQYDSSTQKGLGGEEDYDPEYFVSCNSPKMKKKKDRTRKHSDSKPKTKVQSLLDKLHRQARVEEEVKIVLKDYYKHREISKEEYKDILRKAVPQVANSDHSIDPERIRSLVKKYVAKTKGQRLLKPNS